MPGDGDYLRKPMVGEPIPHSKQTWDAIIDTVQRDRKRLLNGGPGSVDLGEPDGLILVKNNSGSAIARFGVLGISGILISPSTNLPEFQNNAALTGVTPATPTHTGKFVVAYEPIPAGAIGRAFVFGICPVQVNINTAGDKFADVKNGDATQLTSGAIGSAQILYAPASTGTQWALVRLNSGSPGLAWGKLSSASGSSGTNAPPAAGNLTYTVKDLAGNTIGTAVADAFARQSGNVTAATNCIYGYDGNGTLQILVHDEVINSDNCT